MTFKTPLDVRLACRRNELEGFASKALPGYLCVNVAFLDVDYADDFEAFCRANPKPCPLIARMAPGQTDCPEFASELDIRTDLGSYDIVRNGEVTELRKDIVDLFDDRTVTPRIVAQQAKLPFMISYTPGHAMITDIPTESLYQPNN